MSGRTMLCEFCNFCVAGRPAQAIELSKAATVNTQKMAVVIRMGGRTVNNSQESTVNSQESVHSALSTQHSVISSQQSGGRRPCFRSDAFQSPKHVKHEKSKDNYWGENRRQSPPLGAVSNYQDTLIEVKYRFD